MSRLKEVRERGVESVGFSLGLNKARGQAMTPCPACGARQRGSQDRRGPLGITSDGKGFRCFACGVSGDAPTLAALIVTGRTRPDGEWDRVLHACEDGRRLSTGRAGNQANRDGSPGARKATRPLRPPATEVARLWGTCQSVVDDEDAVAFLKGRHLQGEVVAERDLARALPVATQPPRWASFRGGVWETSTSWTETSHRLLVPMYGATGCMESIHARAIAPKDPKGRDKAASPAGYRVGGLVMADRLARQILVEGTAPSWWSGNAVLITEGIPDFLTWTTFYGDSEDVPAVFGVIAGSWSAAIAARIPDGLRVVIRTHLDEAGEKYATKVAKTLASRCKVFRRAK